MTEFWVSQGQKWCESCKIFIANNGASLAMHEQGKRHKEALALRIANVRKNSVTEEREKQKAARDLQRIEAAAERQFAKDVAEQQRAEAQQKLLQQQQLQQQQQQQEEEEREERVTQQELLLRQRAGEEDAAAPSATTGVASAEASAAPEEWVQHPDTGYYFNAASGYYYDADSGLYYSEILGKWTSQEEALEASRGGKQASSVQSSLTSAPSPSPSTQAAVPAASEVSQQPPQSRNSGQVLPAGPLQEQQQQLPRKKVTTAAAASAAIVTCPPGPVRAKSAAVGSKSARGVASSLAVQPKGMKRRGSEAGPLTADEVAAREAREAARRRVEERERSSLGLYHAYT